MQANTKSTSTNTDADTGTHKSAAKRSNNTNKLAVPSNNNVSIHGVTAYAKVLIDAANKNDAGNKLISQMTDQELRLILRDFRNAYNQQQDVVDLAYDAANKAHDRQHSHRLREIKAKIKRVEQEQAVLKVILAQKEQDLAKAKAAIAAMSIEAEEAERRKDEALMTEHYIMTAMLKLRKAILDGASSSSSSE